MNAVIYARYSSYGQTEQSIEGQLRDCRAYAERIGVEVIGEYIDRAVSGTTDDRPDFQRMIDDSEKRLFQYIIVWKLDRFARNRYDSAIYKTRLKKNGVKVLSAMEALGEGAESIILEAILEASAEYYSADLSKKVKRGLRESCIKGTYTGGLPPIGYRVVNKKLVLDPQTAPIIRSAFQMYASGSSKKEVLQTINQSGLVNKRGKPFGMSALQAAFHNRKYIGIFTHGDREVAGGCESLIDKETFERVQQRITAVRHAPAASKAKEEYKLQGKAFCGMCGARLVGESGRGKLGTVYHYYACANRKKLHTCDKLSEKKGFLEWYIVEQTQEYVLTPERIEYISREIIKRNRDDTSQKRIRSLEEKIQRKEKEIQSAVDTLVHTTAKTTIARLDQAIDQLSADKEDMEKDLIKLQFASEFKLTKKDVVKWLEQFCKGDPLDESFQSRIIDTFINSVYVYDDKVIIYYNIKGSQQISYIEMLDSTTEPGGSHFIPDPPADQGSDLGSPSPLE